MAPSNLVRHLTNVNPRDLAISGKYVFVANVNGLGVSIVDLDAQRQVASIDLNAPALGVVPMGPYIFISTLGRFAEGFDDVHNEIAVVDTRTDPFKLRMRFTSTPLPPYGPDLGPGRGSLVPASGQAPYLSAFGVTNFLKTFPYDRNVFAQIEDGFPENPDNLPTIIGGAVPDQMLTIGGQLVVAYDASDELETFSVDLQASDTTKILTPANQVFTNGTQTAFPAAINRKAVFDDEPFLLGKDNPDYFRGRMPQGLVFAESSRKLYVANRLGESVATFSVDENGKPQFESLIDLLHPNSPVFPATLAEVGEDFYTASRVSLSRKISCLSCHPNIHTDSKMWHVAATAGRALRPTLTNRNLRDTPPFYRSGIRRNLEAFRGTFRVMAPEGPFGFFEDPAPFDANGDGVINDRDRGRATSDVNRNRMFVLERTGTSFERTSSAIAAFLEVEPRLLPDPFLGPNGELARSVPVAYDPTGNFIFGDAVRGATIFNAAGCPTCHPSPTFSITTPLSRQAGTMQDVNGDGIPDGVVASLEQTEFDRLRMPFPLPAFLSSLPREGLPFTSIDTDRRLNFANTDNKFVPANKMAIPRSSLSGRLLVSGNEPTCPNCGVTPTTPLLANTRNIDVPSLRGTWDGGPFLEHGRATDLLSVQALFNDIGRHGDVNVLGLFDPLRPLTNRNYLDLAAFLKSIE
jgi:cytochrome c peroxidase